MLMQTGIHRVSALQNDAERPGSPNPTAAGSHPALPRDIEKYPILGSF